MSTMTLPEVIVEDVGMDAALVERPGREPLLVLRPGQSFGSAVQAAQGCLPHLHPEVVLALVRGAMPDAALFAAIPTASAWVPGASLQTPIAAKRERRYRR